LTARASERIRQIDPAARDPASPRNAGQASLPGAFQTKSVPVTDGEFIFRSEPIVARWAVRRRILRQSFVGQAWIRLIGFAPGNMWKKPRSPSTTLLY
jgi:hypothetical protein